MDLLAKEIDRAQRLCRAAGIDEYEIMAAHSRGVTVGVRGQELDKRQASESLGLALRVIVDQRPGFSYVFGADGDQAVARAVELAVAAARAADPQPELGFAEPAAGLPLVQTFDERAAELPLAELIEGAKALAAAARAADKRVIHVHPAEVSRVVSHVRLRTSRGFDQSHAATHVSAGAEALADDGAEQEAGWDSHSACFWSELDLEDIGRRAGRKAVARLGGGPVGDGLYDVVLGREVAAQLLEILGESFLGDNVAKGRSLLAGKLGQELLAPGLAIIDDGLLPRGLGSAPFDDEGEPQRRTVLAAGGVIERFAYDRLWGALAGGGSTGNAVRPSLKAPPAVGFTNLLIEPRAGDQASLLAEMGQGLLIDEIMGGHTADPVSGEFSFGAAGHLVHNGQVNRPVKSIAMAGQILSFFRGIKKIGADIKFFGRVGAPSLLVERVSVSGP
ncbi:peptidase U62 modulator of DNA gyrase [Desulfarculus baarsii DSM 2075]|uniref:Peptidase U62 modulator of DNA gyrase n=1 Tax=Desulfarculus baarsii (strain ATCC 33931 / DSM 2075 / LMG 7858 / VKM B-1802 / 2st14) TaxID=644282 RepID=E1QMH5_DESB2|nr:TldD/PmbA family protein [Desulfarculus baarsii]ADK86218.1 peptidase U62 modulator of DNA gyrase [Desulfarculus baarsii DSM 2075]